MFSNTKKTAIVFCIVAVFLLAIDRYLKKIALNSTEDFNLIGDILRFSFAKNYFIAFSLPLGGKVLIMLISTIIIGLIIYALKLVKNKEWVPASLIFVVILGALSNLLDRLQLAYVVDYLDLKYFTVFNVADSMIVFGIFLLILKSYEKN